MSATTRPQARPVVVVAPRTGVCGCSRPTKEAFLCPTCTSRLRSNLGAVPGVLADLAVTAAKLDVVGARGGMGGGGTVSRLPLNPDAIGAGDQLRWLVGATVPADADRIAAEESGPAFAEELQDMLTYCRRLVDLPADLIHLGTCGNVFENVACEQELFVEPGTAHVHCKCCGHTWDVKARQAEKITSAWNVAARPPLVVKALNTQGVRVKLKDIENWARSGKLIGCVELGGYRSFRVADVYRVAKVMSERRRRKPPLI